MTVTDFNPKTLPEFLRKGPPGLERSPRPEAAPRAVAVEPSAEYPDYPDPPPESFANVERLVRTIVAEVRKQDEPTRNRLNEIASLVHALTYGEMIELAEGLWKLKPEGEITEAMLPGMFHKWSEGRKCASPG